MDLDLRQRDRISVLRQVDEGLLKATAAAERIGVTPRHLRRVLARFRTEGDGVVVHGLCGRRSNRAVAAELREQAMEVMAEPEYHDFGAPQMAVHIERRIGVRVSPDTVVRWKRDAELWLRQRKRAKHRSSRPRKAALGDLVQWDSSVHPWLEDRGPDNLVLIALLDDATSRLQFARFVERDDGAENRRALIEYLRLHGRPVAFYADHASHFGQWMKKRGRRTETIISRGLGELNVELVLASSPQAKGRIERSFGTAQDWLVKEMRVAGIDGLAEANRFLAEHWVPFWNGRYVRDPADPLDAHRPLPPEADLDALFAETETRKVANDFTVRFKNEYWQVRKQEAEDASVRPGSEVVVERRLDGSLRFRIGERYLALQPLGRERPRAVVVTQPSGPKRKPAPTKPGPNHPWQLHFAASVREAKARRDRRLAAEAGEGEDGPLAREQG